MNSPISLSGPSTGYCHPRCYAHDLARQAVRTLEAGFDEIIRNAQLVGESIYADDLREDLEFWRACSAIQGLFGFYWHG